MLKQVHDMIGRALYSCHPEPGPEPCPETSSGSIEFDLRFRDLGFDLGQIRFLKPRSVDGILYCQLYSRESLATKTKPAPAMIRRHH